MRQHAKYFYVLFVIIILSFVFWGVGGVDQPTTKPLAIVGKDTISVEQFWRSYDRTVELYRDVYKDDFDPEAMNLKQGVLQTLIQERLLIAAAHEVGINVTDKELEAAIINDPAFERNGAFSKEIYLRTLQANRLTVSYFESLRRDEITQKRMRQLIGETVKLSPSELRNISGTEEVAGALKEALLQNKRSAAVRSYVRGLMRRFPVKVNSELIA